MRYLFIVQGEGRGHLTQAMSLERLLKSHGHEVAAILVGSSPQRILPDFFLRGVSAPVEQFESMNFMPSSDNRRADMVRTVLVNGISLIRFFPSVRFLRRRIRESRPDVVVNFYELMTGMTYAFYGIKVPMVSIGHQYLFLHRDFGLPHDELHGALALNMFSRMTSMGSVKRLALSFRNMPADAGQHIAVVPPLLRPEVMSMVPSRGNYIHGYMLNAGFSRDVMEWHEKHPEVELRFFRDRQDEEAVSIDDTLSFYRIDDKKFLSQMSGCMAYASTAGFESICEAMYMGKPILMVPSHIEQEINAYDAIRSGAGVKCDWFDLSQLVESAESYRPDPAFREWVDAASEKILHELENIDLH